jgi:hypothetical protein
MTKLFINLIIAFIPIKSLRKSARAFLKGEKPMIPQWLIKLRYDKKIKILKNSRNKVKIVFLVSENSKWNGDSLYKKLKESSKFEPLILIIGRVKQDDINPKGNYEFFKTRGYKVEILKNDNFKKYNPDIIFYQQPWYLPPKLKPWNVSKYALTFYYGYAVSNSIGLGTFIEKASRAFWKSLFAQFGYSQNIYDQMASIDINNVIVSGHPKLDVYNERIKKNAWKDNGKYKIIYAPHHSFARNSLLYATFKWNGREFLKIAKNNPDTEWIFKPHPRFKRALAENNIMTQQEINDYYEQWLQVGQIYEIGDYFDIFRTSDLLITDCDSFLIEYLPTNKPVMHLLSKKENDEPAARHYYKARTLADIEKIFNMLVKKKEDPLKNYRLIDAMSIKTNAADNIMAYLEDIVRNDL